MIAARHKSLQFEFLPTLIHLHVFRYKSVNKYPCTSWIGQFAMPFLLHISVLQHVSCVLCTMLISEALTS